MVVHPKPEVNLPPLPPGQAQSAGGTVRRATRAAANTTVAAYRRGDPPQTGGLEKAAKADELVSRDSEALQRPELWLDPPKPALRAPYCPVQRKSRPCRACAPGWLADQRELRFGLRLGQQTPWRPPAARRTCAPACRPWRCTRRRRALCKFAAQCEARRLPSDRLLDLNHFAARGARHFVPAGGDRLIIAPQFDHLPVWCSAMAAVLLVLRGVLAVRNQSLPSRWWLLVLLVLAHGGHLCQPPHVAGARRGVTSIVVLLSLKTLEMRGRRDAFVVFFLGFFTLLSNFFFHRACSRRRPCWWACWVCSRPWSTPTCPWGAHPCSKRPAMAGWMALLVRPSWLCCLLLFPRVAPLWACPATPLVGRSGLSDRMEVGHCRTGAGRQHRLSRALCGRPPPQAMLYFRGLVLSRFLMGGAGNLRTRPHERTGPGWRPHCRCKARRWTTKVTPEPEQPLAMVLEATPSARACPACPWP